MITTNTAGRKYLEQLHLARRAAERLSPEAQELLEGLTAGVPEEEVGPWLGLVWHAHRNLMAERRDLLRAVEQVTNPHPQFGSPDDKRYALGWLAYVCSTVGLPQAEIDAAKAAAGLDGTTEYEVVKIPKWELYREMAERLR